LNLYIEDGQCNQIAAAFSETLRSTYYMTADSGLIGYWRFDRAEDPGAGSDGPDDIRDLGPHAHHGDMTGDGELVPVDRPVPVAIRPESMPLGFFLEQKYPNPFNPGTVIRYHIPEESGVSLRVFNLTGQPVEELSCGMHRPGAYTVRWNGTDIRDRPMAGGVHVCILKTSAVRSTKKRLLVR